MQTTQTLALLILACLATVTSPVGADIIEMADGTRLVGTITQITDDTIVIETTIAGTLKIDRTKLLSLQTDQPFNVSLASGDKLVGPIAITADSDKPVVKTAMGDIPVSVDDIDAVWGKDAKSPEILAMEKELQKKLPDWSLTVEAGITFTEGNSDTLDARGGFDLRRKTDRELLRFYLTGAYAEENDDRSEAEVKGGIGYENNITERFFAYVNNDLEYDEFEELELRYTLTMGVGYYWIKQERQELKTRVGAGYRHETFFDGSTVNEPILDLGLNYRLDITEWLRFTHATTYNPSLEGIDDYRLTSDNAFLIPIAKSEIWKIKLGALYEYDSQPEPGVESLDQTYYANLVLDID